MTILNRLYLHDLPPRAMAFVAVAFVIGPEVLDLLDVSLESARPVGSSATVDSGCTSAWSSTNSGQAVGHRWLGSSVSATQRIASADGSGRENRYPWPYPQPVWRARACPVDLCGRVW
jgi:hypothetical protein